MPQVTANLALPLIAAAQASKHVTHNEALTALDTLVQLACLDKDLAAPPANPLEGDRYLVATASPTGAWAGLAGQIVRYQDGYWIGFPPRTGWFAWVADERDVYTYTGSAWIGFRATLTAFQNLSLLGLGTTADTDNPFSAKLNKALWTARGTAEGGSGDLRYTLNKEAAGRTLSLLMQTGFSARAEIGLTGDDDLHVKVSANGTTFVEALRVDRSTGAVAHVAGTAAAPALAPAGDSNTGIFAPAADTWAVATNGVERLRVASDGRIGLGAIAPRSSIDTGLGILTGSVNDYALAKHTMTGGGVITWAGLGGRLKWTQRLLVIPVGHATFQSGYVGITQPTTDFPAGWSYDGVARSCTAAGVVLNAWEGLYAVHTPGGDNGNYTLRIVCFTSTFVPANNWILIAAANGDNGTVRLGSGVVLKSGGSWTAGTDAQYAPMLPSPDSSLNLGGPSNRYATLYAATGAINTSDAREKSALAPLTSAEIAAAKVLSERIGTFRFLDAAARKGNAARMHVGLTVQEAIAILHDHGLDAFAYGFICHDVWDASPDHPDGGDDPKPAPILGGEYQRPAPIPAGDRYGFRTDELLLFLARGFDARLTALETA